MKNGVKKYERNSSGFQFYGFVSVPAAKLAGSCCGCIATCSARKISSNIWRNARKKGAFVKRGNCKTHLPVKIALLRPFASILLDRPFRVGLVEYTVAAPLPLANGLKIIDFPRQSSFAIPSKGKRWPFFAFHRPL
jgi:hypothetical protein